MGAAPPFGPWGMPDGFESSFSGHMFPFTSSAPNWGDPTQSSSPIAPVSSSSSSSSPSSPASPSPSPSPSNVSVPGKALSLSSSSASASTPPMQTGSATPVSLAHYKTLIAAIIGGVGGTLVLLAVIVTLRRRTSRRTSRSHGVEPFATWRIRRAVSVTERPQFMASNADRDSLVTISTSYSRIVEVSDGTVAERILPEVALPSTKLVKNESLAVVRHDGLPRQTPLPTQEPYPPPPPSPPPPCPPLCCPPPPASLPPPPSPQPSRSPPPLPPSPPPLPSAPPSSMLQQPLPLSTALQHQDSGIRLAPTDIEELPPAYSRD